MQGTKWVTRGSHASSDHTDQMNLFGGPDPVPGLRYQPNIVPPPEQHRLVEAMAALPLAPFEFHGHVGNRRVVSFGRRYDFARRRLEGADEPPAFLMPLIERGAELLNVGRGDIRHVLVTEYDVGAGIGWHRDKPEFREIVAFSFVSLCRLRFRLNTGPAWRRAALDVAPGSAYVMSGPARSEWEHSIAPVDRLRYSVTMRTLALPRR